MILLREVPVASSIDKDMMFKEKLGLINARFNSMFRQKL